MFEEIKNILNRFNSHPSSNVALETRNNPPADQFKKRPETIVICNQKGGCGKTTTAINLSAYLAKKGHRVLVIDLDTQAHASVGLGIDVDNLTWTIHDVLIHNEPFEKVIVPTCMENLFIAPANHLLSGAQIQLANLISREKVLKLNLKKLFMSQHFDYVIIDTSPTLNLITLNGLVAADQVLVPIQTHYFALEGMKELFFTIDLVKEQLNPDLKIMGLLATLFDPTIEANREILNELNEYFGNLMFKSVIHYTSALIEASRYRKPAVLYAPDSKGALYYLSLADEVEHLMLKERGSGR